MRGVQKKPVVTLWFAAAAFFAFIAGLVAMRWHRSAEHADRTAQERLRITDNRAHLQKNDVMASAPQEQGKLLDSYVATKSEIDNLVNGQRARSVDVTGSLQEKDEQWERFPRSAFSFSTALGRHPQGLEARSLFRHKDLNPLDRYVGPDSRSILSKGMDLYRARIEEADTLQRRLSISEFQKLKKDNRLATRSLEQMRQDLTPEELAIQQRAEAKIRAANGGKDPAYPVIVPSLLFKDQRKPHAYESTSSGQLLSATLEELPATEEAVRLRDFITMEYGAFILTWFAENTGLPTARYVDMLSATEDVLKRKH